jgi:hypothetical protein
MSTRSEMLEKSLDDGSPAYFATQKDYGEARGVKKQSVSRWKKRGLIVLADDGEGGQLVDAVASDRRRAEGQNPLKAQAAPGPADDDDEDPAPRQSVDPSRLASQQADAVTRTFTAKTKRVQYERLVGSLVDKKGMSERWNRLAGRLVTAIMMTAIPAANRIDPKDPRKARGIIVEELRLGLEAFASDLGEELLEEAAEEALALQQDHG